MGDARFQHDYEAFRDAADRGATLRAMSDDSVVAALAAASREHDPYLANVLASEAFNRMRRATTMTRHLGEGALTIDPEGRILAANPMAASLLRAPANDLRGRHIHAVLHGEGSEPAHDDAASCPLSALIDSGETIRQASDTFKRADDTTFPASFTATPVLDENIPVGLVVVFQDVTERRANERRLAEQTAVLEQTIANTIIELRERQKAESLFRSLIETAPDAMIVAERSGRIVIVNPEAARLFSAPSGELLGSHVDALLPGLRLAAFHQHGPDRRLPLFELEATPHDGEPFLAEVGVSLITAEPKDLVTIVVRDVSARRAASVASAHLAAIVEASPDPIVSVDRDMRITTWNRAAADAFDHPPSRAVGQEIGLIVPSTQRQEERAIIARVLAGERIGPMARERVRAAGDHVLARVTYTPIKEAAGRVVGVTTLQRLEDALDPDRLAIIETERMFERAVEQARRIEDARRTHFTHGPLPAVRGRPARVERLFTEMLVRSVRDHPGAARIHVESAPHDDVWTFSVAAEGAEPDTFDLPGE